MYFGDFQNNVSYVNDLFYTLLNNDDKSFTNIRNKLEIRAIKFSGGGKFKCGAVKTLIVIRVLHEPSM